MRQAVTNLLEQFKDNHGSKLQKIQYEPGIKFNDTQGIKNYNILDSTAGEQSSPFQFPKYITVKSQKGLVSNFGKTFVSYAPDVVTYNNSGDALNDPRIYIRLFFPSRSTLKVQDGMLTNANSTTPTAANTGTKVTPPNRTNTPTGNNVGSSISGGY